MKKIVVIAGVVLLVGGGTFGGLMLGKSMAKPAVVAEENTDANEVVADAKGEGAHGETKAAADGKGEAKPADGHGAPADGQAAASADASTKPSRKDLIFAFQKDFVVNLLDPRGNIYLQTQIEIEARDLDARAQLEDNMAPLRDATMMLLSSKQRDQVSTPEGKQQLKRELLARYEGIMKPGTIREIYFTDMAVTRQ